VSTIKKTYTTNLTWTCNYLHSSTSHHSTTLTVVWTSATVS